MQSHTTMNSITLSPSTFSTNMKAWDIRSGTGEFAAATASWVAQVWAVKSPTSEAQPRRPGALSPHDIVREKEARDPEFAASIASARQRLGSALYGDKPTSLASMRLAKGLSQAKLAELVYTSQSHVAKIESGKIQILFSTASAIADALDVSLDDLCVALSSYQTRRQG